ncbi:MAG: DUF2716 domain-containing protein [Ruminococcus sp.]|nr:DUF2716 domain-containing protein [Ruminococcus sp.]
MQVITDEKLYNDLWDRIYREYSFSPQNEKWLCPDIAYDVYRLGPVWDEKQAEIIDQIFCRLVSGHMYALDWHHDCFIFDPHENIPFGYQYYDDSRDCTVYFPTYYPDGDFYFFIAADWSFGMFGHPWRNELIVTGIPLRREIEKAAKELDLEKQ